MVVEEPHLDCVDPGGELGVGVLHVEEGVVGVALADEGMVHGDSLVSPVVGSGVDGSLSDSGLMFGAAAASMADSVQTASTTWNWF